MSKLAILPTTSRKRSSDSSFNLSPLHEEFDRMFRDFFHAPTHLTSPFGSLHGSSSNLTPSMDFTETDKAYELTTELPGVDEKEIEMSLSDGMLTISGEKKSTHEESDKNLHRMERSFGSFKRAVSLPNDVDIDQVKATLKNGVLTVSMPKVPESQGRSRKLEISKS